MTKSISSKALWILKKDIWKKVENKIKKLKSVVKIMKLSTKSLQFLHFQTDGQNI